MYLVLRIRPKPSPSEQQKERTTAEAAAAVHAKSDIKAASPHAGGASAADATPAASPSSPAASPFVLGENGPSSAPAASSSALGEKFASPFAPGDKFPSEDLKETKRMILAVVQYFMQTDTLCWNENEGYGQVFLDPSKYRRSDLCIYWACTVGPENVIWDRKAPPYTCVENGCDVRRNFSTFEGLMTAVRYILYRSK